MRALLIGLGAATVVIAGIALWLSYELWRAHELLHRVSKMLRRPEIERDRDGRPLRERV